MVRLLAPLVEGPPTRLWVIGQSREQAALDVLKLLLRTALLSACGACW
jgi:hypothetical protein